MLIRIEPMWRRDATHGTDRDRRESRAGANGERGTADPMRLVN